MASESAAYEIKPSTKGGNGGDRLEKPGKTDGNASFLRAARAGNLDKVLEYLKGNIDINTSNANGLNALHLASKEGHVNVVTELLARGADVDAATKKGNTALHIASLAGKEDIVKILVQHGAKVNVQSQNGFTPLYMASQENHADVVKFLLANGASQALTTEDGFSPMAVALQQGREKVVAVLLEHDSRSRVRLPALHIAAKKNDVKAASLLLKDQKNVNDTSKSGSMVNEATKSGFTPLHIASHYGNVEVGTLLIEKGGDVNYQARNHITPLHVGSKWGRTNMVTALADHNAKIDCQTRDGLTPLHCAARSGHDQVVDVLLEKGAPVYSKTKNGLTPLHMSAQGDHVDCARILLYHKAPIDEVTVDYLTPLHVAAHCGNVKTAKLLLDKKCTVDSRALNGFTPLHIACKKNRIKVVELLLKYMASIEATTESGLTPLHVASFMGHLNIVVLLIQHGANPDTKTVRGETALHLAARANQTDIMRILLRNGASVDAKAREDQTPLHIASRLGNVDNVVLLLQHGADPNAATKDHYTPLHIAAKEGHEEVAAALLDHSARHDLTTKKGFTPLHIASKYGNVKVARLLLQREADPNAAGKNGLTPLHVATHYNHPQVALLLLENKADPYAKAKNGYTPLHIAAKKNQMDIATSLLEYKADPNAESKNGFSPLHLASQEGHTDMVSLLLEHKADVNCRAKNGLTPMHLAAQEDRVPVAEILVKYDAEIDPQTKAGYTPLHTACHFGQINMIRFLLEHNASVNSTTKLGYTPLHQAAQQGHVLVINLLLKYKASPNTVSNNGQTPLSIAQKLGYISVVEVLKNVTEVTATPPTDEKYKVVSPETMQETLMTDSEDEGGEDTLIGDQSYQYLPDDDYKLQDDSLSPVKDDRDLQFFERFSTASSMYGPERFSTTSTSFAQDPNDSHVVREPSAPIEEYPVEEIPVFEAQEERLQSAAAPQHYAGYAVPPSKAISEDSRGDTMYDSTYSGVSFASSFDPDNIAIDRHPVYSGFLVSFMVDARGGAMRGCRHSGVRIIVPPGKACMPTRVTCKLVKREKLVNPPPIMEGEALASRLLEMGPVGAKFAGPVIIEVPHFASLRGKEREIVILRSDNGETWYAHDMEATEDAIHEALAGSFEGEDLESAEELYQKRITRILTTDFPQYFAIVTRIRQEKKTMGPDGGMLSSTVVPQVQAVFPPGALTKNIKVGLQAQPIPPDQVSKMLGNRVAVSPIVTVEPRRRKFHKPITLTIPLPKASQKGMLNQYDKGGETPTLRLLCSITGAIAPSQWEDITGTTPLTFVEDCVSFTTTVSARFWLMDCQNINESAKMATELYRDAIAVPFMSKFVVFAKRHDPLEARLRVFCMTDDKMDKTLETQEHFTEVARSRDVEVLEGKPQYVEMGGNLVPVTKSGDQLYVNFHAFRENRLPCVVRIRDSNQEPSGRVAFMRDPKVARGEAPQQPICNLNVDMPASLRMEPQIDTAELEKKYMLMRQGASEPEQISKAELRLTDIADTLQGDWVVLARQLNVSEEEITKIQTEYNYVGEQALVMLHLWVQKNGENATGNELERALKKIGREDIIRKCMYNVEEVTDVVEKAVAKGQLDQEGFDELKEELGPSRDSSMHRGMSLDVQFDEQDIIKESESAAESGSDAGSMVEREPGRVEDDVKDAAAKLAQEELVAAQSQQQSHAAPQEGFGPDDLETGVRVYTDTIEGEPAVETDVQEFEETLPDGTVVRRKVIKTKQRQTIVKRVIMEGPETDLPSTEEQAQAILDQAHYEPTMTRYADRLDGEPESSTDVQEYEDVLPDGTVVKKRVITTTEQQLKTERTVLEGDQVPNWEAEGEMAPDGEVFLETGPLSQAARPVAEDAVEAALQQQRQSRPPQHDDRPEYDEDMVVVSDESADPAYGAAPDHYHQQQQQQQQRPADEDSIEPLMQDQTQSESIEQRVADTQQYAPDELTHPDEQGPYEEVGGGRAQVEVEEVQAVPSFDIESAPTSAVVREVDSSSSSSSRHGSSTAPVLDLGLVAPAIAIQEPSPLVQSPTEENVFIPTGVKETEVDLQAAEHTQSGDSGEGPVTHESCEKVETFRGGLTTKKLAASASIETQQGSKPPSELGSQDASPTGDEEIERPLSPTDYTLEPDTDIEPEGRIGADTSQQIFIEQSIEAARHSSSSVAAEDRPPSPSEYTLVTEEISVSHRQTVKGSIPEDVFSVPEPFELREGHVSVENVPSSEEVVVAGDGFQSPPSPGSPVHAARDTTTDTPADDCAQAMWHAEDRFVGSGDTTQVRLTRDASDTSFDTECELTMHATTTTATTTERREETTISRTHVASMSLKSSEHETESPSNDDQAFIQTYEHSGDTTISSENFESEHRLERETVTLGEEPFDPAAAAALLEDKHRLMSSSYEDIYVKTNFPTEDDSQDELIGQIGDRFDTRHVDPHLVHMPDGKSCSFENLYDEATSKESKDIEEKDVDEKGDAEVEVDQPEKGEREVEKDSAEQTLVELEQAEQYDSFEMTSSATAASEEVRALDQKETEAESDSDSDNDRSPPAGKSPPQIPTQSSPIDMTYESGLDLVGHEGEEDEVSEPTRVTVHQEDHDSLERSLSYDSQPGGRQPGDLQRQRHFSSPDDVLNKDLVPVAAPNGDKDVWQSAEGREDDRLSTSSSELAQLDEVVKEGQASFAASESQATQEDPSDGGDQMVPDDVMATAEEDDDGELQTARVVMKKQVHKKTIIRDGKEETIVTEDTHVEQDNEGPEELKQSMQQMIDQFMEGKTQLGDPPQE